MAITTKTLRTVLLGSLSEFSDSCNLAGLITSSTLSALVVSLANYHEEGQSLTPELYFFDELIAVSKLLPGHDILQVGSEVDGSKVGFEALKKCAPLARSGWAIYIENKRKGQYHYGVFRGSLNPLAISVESTFFSEKMESIFVARLCQTATNCVELKNSRGETCHLLLNDKPENSPPPNEHLGKVVEKISARVNKDNKESTKSYLYSLISSSLNESHGSLIAVSSNFKIPRSLTDGSVLNDPIDFGAIVESFRLGQNQQENEHKLNAYKSLISGMISSDGIVVFDSKARLLAFNCFIHSPTNSTGKKINGGARTRAFEALSNLVGTELTTAFVRSQDGWTKLRVN